MEIWKKVVGIEGYLVSSKGRVWSMNRVVVAANGREHTAGGFYLKPHLTAQGYVKISLQVSTGNAKLFFMHRLVAQAFLENPENKPQVNHKNGDKLDNGVANLEWSTSKENITHSFAMGLNTGRAGSDHPTYKGDIIVSKNGKDVAVLRGNKDMKAKGFCPQMVSRCVLGLSKTHKGLTFTRKCVDSE